MIATEVQVGSEEIGTDVSGRVLLGGKMEDRSPTYESANHVVNRLSETVPSPTRKLSSPLFNLIVGEYGDESKLAHVSISKQAMRENDKDCIVPGLLNLGNTCFMNSVLQAFSSSPNFYAFICAVVTYISSSLENENIDENSVCATTSLKRVLDQLQHKYADSGLKPGPLNTRKLSNDLCKYNKSFAKAIHEQQDAHEFLHFLLEAVEKDIEEVCSYNMGRIFFDITTKADDELMKVSEKPSSPLSGRLINEMTCLTCYRESPPSSAVFSVLSLPIVSRLNSETSNSRNLHTLSSLWSSLEEYTSSERIDGVFCHHCKAKTTVRRRITIEKVPKVLCLHLNRKYFHLKAHKMIKIEQHVEFPQKLDISPFLFYNRKRWYDDTLARPPQSNGALYELVGVIVHHGASNGGHYTAYRKLNEKKWVNTSDTHVVPTSIHEVLRSNLYIGVFERV